MYWSEHEGLWITKIGIRGKTITLGRFADFDKAKEAREAAEAEIYQPILDAHPEFDTKK